jgi:hypothetical protein
MTIGAGVIPVVFPSHPVKPVTGLTMTGRQKEPPLSALMRSTRIPRYCQRLKTTALQLDDVLLKRINSECPLDRILVNNPILTAGLYEILVSPAKE